ncbi:MAG TPA: hypothetical protein VH437_01560 [Terriglobales bacterium]
MNLSSFPITIVLLPLLAGSLTAQSTSAAQPAPPVAYSSMSQLNMLLSELEQASQGTQSDLARLRVDKWKTDSNTKRQEQANVESLQRNLQSALPEMITQIRTSPEDLNVTFKIYRNLDALYDVLGSLVESAGAFGSKDDFQSLGNDLSSVEKSRRSFADRMETLAGAKEVELTQLRTQVRTLQAAVPPPAPKKVIVDDTETPKKPTKKKSAKPATPAPAPTTPPQ